MENRRENNTMNGSVNLGQLLTAIAKIVIIIVLPIIMFTIPLTGIPIPGAWLTGFRMMNMGNMFILIPLVAYLAMVIFSLGSLQRISIIPAAAGIIFEFVVLVAASIFVNSGDIKFLISLIPADYQQYVSAGLTYLAKPGYGIWINLGLSILYIVFHFLPIGGLGSSGFTGGVGGIGRPNINSNRGNPTSGGINRPRV